MMDGFDTERLRLRAWRDSDIGRLAQFYVSDDSQFVGGPLSLDDTWRRMAMFVGHWTLRGFGNWVIEEKSSGEQAGYAGLWHPLGWPEREIIWILFDGFRGKGYATEAAGAAREHAYRRLGWSTAVSYISPANRASEHVAQRLGAHRETQITLRGQPTDVWRHPSPS
jgi:RimJ/RimL family protein N-acetyltransferase